MRMRDFVFNLNREMIRLEQNGETMKLRLEQNGGTMKRDFAERLCTAGEYQKKAVRALFSDKMNGHLDVIEREVKAMFVEMLSDVMSECQTERKRESGPKAAKGENARKIDIL